MSDTLMNFHLIALRGVLKEMENDVPNADDATFKSQIELLKKIRKNIQTTKATTKA
jgi:hypothetical protein